MAWGITKTVISITVFVAVCAGVFFIVVGQAPVEEKARGSFCAFNAVFMGEQDGQGDLLRPIVSLGLALIVLAVAIVAMVATFAGLGKLAGEDGKSDGGCAISLFLLGCMLVCFIAAVQMLTPDPTMGGFGMMGLAIFFFCAAVAVNTESHKFDGDGSDGAPDEYTPFDGEAFAEMMAHSPTTPDYPD